MNMDFESTKVCTRCGGSLSVNDFSTDAKGRLGRGSRCRACIRALWHERRLRLRPNARKRVSPLDAAGWEAVRMIGSMTCHHCSTERCLADFRRIDRGDRPPVYRRVCRSCDRQRERERHKRNPEQRRRHARQSRCRKYGITLGDYERMLAEQHGRCSICGESFGNSRRGLAIDHDHASGRVRGLVHSQCNVMIAMAKEQPLRLYHGIAYLLHHHPDRVWQVVRQAFLPPQYIF
jgi:hypothetical protein